MKWIGSGSNCWCVIYILIVYVIGYDFGIFSLSLDKIVFYFFRVKFWV